MAAAIVITRDAAAFSKNNPTVDITLKLKYTILKIDIDVSIYKIPRNGDKVNKNDRINRSNLHQRKFPKNRTFLRRNIIRHNI